ncbi:MAG: phosphoribosylanthranilate isomerase [Gammaproteobacteria bacterium]
MTESTTRTAKLRTRVKVCGITRIADAEAAADLGADAVGMIFWRPSSRYVQPATAARIGRSLPPMMSAVGVFVDPPAEDVQALLDSVHCDLLQFHGDEAPDFCGQFGVPYVKAVRMRGGVDLHAVAELYADARALLLDTYRENKPGGTGEIFDWASVPANLKKPVIIAGGLDAACVGQAIAAVKPYAVDVSGGVESAPGIKDPKEIEAFIREVQRAQVQAQ